MTDEEIVDKPSIEIHDAFGQELGLKGMAVGRSQNRSQQGGSDVATRTSATVRRRRLGDELRRLRKEAGCSLYDAAERIDKSIQSISRLERGEGGSQLTNVEALLELYGVDDEESRTALLDLARRSSQKDWWHGYGSVLPDWFESFVGFEHAAARIHTYQVQTVHGLLQTEAYAHALLQAGQKVTQAEQIDRLVEVRMTRQRLLTSEDPPEFWVVLDEAVLHRPVGGADVMAEQLDHLVRMSALPNVTLQVVPFGVGAHTGMNGAFTLFRFPDYSKLKDPDIVYVEHVAGSLYKERPEEVRRYMQVFDQLRAVGLGPADSVRLIANAAREGTEHAWQAGRAGGA